MLCLGFTRSPHDYCLYVRKRNGNVMYLILYVEDLLISGSSVSEIEDLKKQLSKQFLGTMVEYNREEGILRLSQISSLAKILQDFEMADCKGSKHLWEKVYNYFHLMTLLTIHIETFLDV